MRDDGNLIRRGPDPAALPPAPERTTLLLAAAISAGQLEVAAGYFARDACLVTPGATAIHGRNEIRALLTQLIDRGSRIDVVLSTCLRAGEVAFARQQWNLTSNGPEGDRHTESLGPTLVLRRLDGEWKLAIAMPWG
jgi:ketosteroid isomerase-like protein